MRTKKKARGIALLAGAGLTALALAGASAQPAPETGEVVISDDMMDPEKLVELLGSIPKPSRTGNDKVACDRATRAMARREAGLSTAEEHSRAMADAKNAAATDAMRGAIDSGMIPACPPDGDPTSGGVRP